jgi:hypothetical protein
MRINNIEKQKPAVQEFELSNKYSQFRMLLCGASRDSFSCLLGCSWTFSSISSLIVAARCTRFSETERAAQVLAESPTGFPWLTPGTVGMTFATLWKNNHPSISGELSTRVPASWTITLNFAPLFATIDWIHLHCRGRYSSSSKFHTASAASASGIARISQTWIAPDSESVPGRATKA